MERCIRRMEYFLSSVGGFKMMYADSFLTITDFRDMFDHTLYDRVRDKHGGKSRLPELYDKISRRGRRGKIFYNIQTLENKNLQVSSKIFKINGRRSLKRLSTKKLHDGATKSLSLKQFLSAAMISIELTVHHSVE